MTRLQNQPNTRHCCSHRSRSTLPFPYNILTDWRMEEVLDFEGGGDSLPFPYEVLERWRRGRETTWEARPSHLPFPYDALQYWHREIERGTVLHHS
jgi:hypothetical protein